jgi:3-polyprenyl-4-hydroxybenzoate decarboxylase
MVPGKKWLSTISLENILRLSSSGTTIAPYMPAFYDIF